MINYKPIDRSLVHKEKIENVLLANLRRILPQSIDSNRFNNTMAEFDEGSKQILESVYEKSSEKSIFGAEGIFIAREALGSLELLSKEFEQLRSKLSEDRITELEASYRPIEDKYQLIKPLTDGLLNQVIRLADKHSYYLDNEVQASASELLEPLLDEEQKNDIFFANMIVDSSHYFFFEHPNEHVPGIMILEAARQMIIACAHIFGNVPQEGSQMILDLLEARFSGYLELYSPIVLRAEVMNKRIKKGSWSSVTLEISLHQSGQKLGVVTCSGSHVRPGLFKMIREMKKDELTTLPFFPEPDLDYTLLVKASDGGFWHEYNITKINLTKIELENPIDLESDGSFDFVLLVPILGTVKGICSRSNSESNNELIFTDLSSSDTDRLELLLKRYCKVPEEAVL